MNADISPSPGRIDPHVFDELQAEAGADFVADLVDTFGEEAPALITAMLQAVATPDDAAAAERFRMAAHSLKSNSLTFGATRLAALALALERGALPADDAPVQAVAAEFQATLAALQALAKL